MAMINVPDCDPEVIICCPYCDEGHEAKHVEKEIEMAIHYCPEHKTVFVWKYTEQKVIAELKLDIQEKDVQFSFSMFYRRKESEK